MLLTIVGENSKPASKKRVKLVDILMFKETLDSSVYVADGVSDGMEAYLELMPEQVKQGQAKICNFNIV